MTPHESVELAALERAIRSLDPQPAPAVLRSALRRDLAREAAARGAPGLGWPLAPLQRLALAIVAALFVMASGWAVAASEPGNIVFPIKDAIVRLFAGPSIDEFHPLLVPELPARPSTTLAPGSSGSPPAPDRSDATAAPVLPEVVPTPVLTPAPALTPTVAPATTSGPAHATPAVPPDPAGPRATPAVPPPRF